MEARDLLAPEFLLIYGDSSSHYYRSVLNTLLESDALATVVVYDNGLGDSSVRNNIAVDDDRVSRYDKDGTGVDSYVEAGVLALRRAITNLMPPMVWCHLKKKFPPN